LIHRLLLLPCGTWGQVVRVIPPLVTTESEIDQAVAVIGSALDVAKAAASA
jgi:4-aminobutyrate aminotransferase-like enzyme